MRRPAYSSQFKRDVRVSQKRGKDIEKLKILITLLIEGSPLPAMYLDHPLKGQWRSFRDAHVEPDWLLIYKVDGDVVRFERTGRHADLFDD
ncbi:type II toxin-antitoxin system mRNA interferase toxin, RelE/StbE family [Xylella taiwanensis]|uniref:Type II toxin-antitoxin system mRNA interferase toxin, RelE/StbE family n=1 Tax=Xylella taiwanensis TaxID=1444770 RepID=Z9JHK5_9GAMM|nr:type II toxin-antitoxin system mRNA interferase toxin, RelE/StbE family [Xylella taiwanensis]AXI83580.1 damage-inducible protein [Xylella taiwanensis]EWS77301.1 mRNA interferase YafQ [Xylella taiwanensis]MCD8456659.1 type II toxin-antitoxin system mRNA interferase toxin, RelE/StbE family [Xylella taiwanensis]MCD8459066.1 type II toxin-antitoxin system mRNA interferase toxin, RelE/StbE family [Xylella taiwanensis]MCD8462041.1 type II toxin-antitoxin system mRNA interferase toxin, RelE/StbE f